MQRGAARSPAAGAARAGKEREIVLYYTQFRFTFSVKYLNILTIKYFNETLNNKLVHNGRTFAGSAAAVTDGSDRGAADGG
jgi:hypothetical protein